MPSFLSLLKQEFIALLKFPTTKDSNEIRFQKRIVRFPTSTYEKRRSRMVNKVQGVNNPLAKKTDTNPSSKKQPSSIRPRSLSTPNNVKVEQKHISRRSESTPQNKLSQKILLSSRKMPSVNVTRKRSSTVVQIEV